MTSDRILEVGIAWTVFLIGLLVVRELVRAVDRPGWRPVLPFINVLVVVMLFAAGLAAVIRLASLASPSTSGSTDGRPTPVASAVAAGPTPVPPSPQLSLEPLPTSSTVPLSPVPRSPTPPTPARTSAAPGTPIPTPVPILPSATPVPTPAPTAVPATPVPTPTLAPSVDVAAGSVSAGPRFSAYDVSDGRVTGYRTVQVTERFTAAATDPMTYAFPTLSDPDGAIRLVRIQTGPLAGVFLSPDEPGVDYRPAG